MSTTAPVMDTTSAAIGRDFYANSLDFEFATTKKVLAAVKQGDWKPDPKSRSAMELAWHLVASEIWFLNGIANQDFTPADEKGLMPPNLEGVLAYYEAEYPKAMARVKALPGNKLAEIVDFYGMKMPNINYLGFALVHTVHHRAQLSTYLRPLGGKCPDIYGGSADVPWEG
jgi:uncharacterized damage-inducible protein DinB